MNISSDDQTIFLENIVDTIRESLIVLDDHMRVITVNRSFMNTFKVSPEETEGRLIYELGNGQWDFPELHTLLEQIVPNKTTIESFEVKHQFQTIGQKVMQLNARRLLRANGKSAMILMAIADITEKYFIRKELEASEANYRKFTEEAYSIVIGIDPLGTITFFNKFSEKVFGYQRNEVIGKPLLGTIIPVRDSSGKDTAESFSELLIHPEKVAIQEMEGLRKDGSVAYLSFSTKGIIGADGTINEIIIDGNDHTELLTARRLLIEKSSTLDTLLTFIPYGIVICDLDDVVCYASRAMETLFKIPPESMINVNGNKYLRKTNLKHSDGRRVTDIKELPMFKVVRSGKPSGEYNLTLEQDGSTRILSIDAAPTFDSNNNITGAIGIWHDMTEEKKSEQAIKESEVRFRTLADNISQLVWMADMQGNLFWFNKRWYEFTGTTYDEIMKKGLGIVVHPDYFEKVMSGYLNAVQKGESWTETFPMRKRDGSYRWFLAHAMPIFDDDHTVIRWFGTNTDVTDLHDIHEELRIAAERFKRIMSSNIVGMVISDLNGAIISANQYYYNLTGYSEEEIRQKNILWTTLTAPEYAAADAKASDELRQYGTCTPYEKEYIRKDGSRVWILIGVTMLPRSQEQGIAFLLDISTSKRALEDAQQRRAEIEAILDSIPDGYIFMDRDGFIEKTNDRARSLIGLTEQNMKLPLAERIKELSLLDENGAKCPLEQLPSWRALHGETVREFIQQVKKDGTTSWVASSASPITYNGEMLGAILEFVDITQLHRLQEEITEERNFVNAVLQTTGALITVLDENFRIIRFNKACEELTGYSADEVINQPVIRLFVPDEEYPAVMKIVERLTSGERIIEHENHWKTRAGEKRFIRWRNSVLTSPSGNVSYIIAAGIDITDRKKLEEQLRRYQDRLEFDFDAMNRLHEIASIFVGENEIQRVFDQIVDTATAIAHDNMGSLQLLDKKSKSLLLRSSQGLSDRWVEFWKVIEKCDEICEQTINKKRREIIENIAVNTLYKGKPSYEILLAEGISAMQSTPIISRSGELLGILTTCNYKPGRPDDHSLWVLDLLARQTADIIDRINTQQTLAESKKQLEEHTEGLYEANRDLESFSYSVSHDLRGPLSVMKGLTDIIEEDYADKFDNDGRAYLQSMRSSVEKMKNLIDDILNLSRIGRQEVKRENVNLSSMVHHYLKELSSQEPSRKTEFFIEDNVTVNADPRLVHVELENLLRNSWKFTSKKDVTRIEFGRVLLDGKVAFFVKDNGAGFDQKFADAIFEPFRRVHTEKEYYGTGVGLSIVQRVIKKHNGKIWAEGTPDKGAAFYFTLE